MRHSIKQIALQIIWLSKIWRTWIWMRAAWWPLRCSVTSIMTALTLLSAAQTFLACIRTSVYWERRTRKITAITTLNATQDAVLNRSVLTSSIVIRVVWKILTATITLPQIAAVKDTVLRMWYAMGTKSMVITAMITMNVSQETVTWKNTFAQPILKAFSLGILFSNSHQSASS